MMTTKHLALLSLLCSPLAACVTDAGEGAGALDDETLGTTESTLCSDGAADAVVPFEDLGGFSGATSALPTNSYDHPACSDRFAVEVTGVSAATQSFSVAADWGESLPSTQSACELALANVQTHEYAMTGFNCSGSICFPVYGWRQVGGDITLRGNWLPFFGSHYCALVPDSPLPELQPSAFRSKVRVSVRAYAWAVFFPAYKRGEAGVYSQPIIY
jgi:hypothetical protein